MTDKPESQLDLWAGGEDRRKAGQASVETSNSNFVAMMRNHAVGIATKFGQVTSDDLREYAKRHGVSPAHPNAWGSIFRGKILGHRWIVVGRMKSKLATNHSREIRIWALQEIPK